MSNFLALLMNSTFMVQIYYQLQKHVRCSTHLIFIWYIIIHSRCWFENDYIEYNDTLQVIFLLSHHSFNTSCITLTCTCTCISLQYFPQYVCPSASISTILRQTGEKEKQSPLTLHSSYSIDIGQIVRIYRRQMGLSL